MKMKMSKIMKMSKSLPYLSSDYENVKNYSYLLSDIVK